MCRAMLPANLVFRALCKLSTQSKNVRSWELALKLHSDRGQAQHSELGYGPNGRKSAANPDKCNALDNVYTHRVGTLLLGLVSWPVSNRALSSAIHVSTNNRHQGFWILVWVCLSLLTGTGESSLLHSNKANILTLTVSPKMIARESYCFVVEMGQQSLEIKSGQFWTCWRYEILHMMCRLQQALGTCFSSVILIATLSRSWRNIILR